MTEVMAKDDRPDLEFGPAPAPALCFFLLTFALLFPSFVSWADFVFLASGGGGVNPAQQLAYGAGKLVQFSWPIFCVWLVERRFPRPGMPTRRGLGPGLAFGLVVVAGMLVLYYGILRDTTVFDTTAVQLRHKLEEYGIASRWGFALFAVFLTLLHSGLEEYYWRWFVFGWLRRWLSLGGAMTLSSLGFMAHHVIILHVFFPGQFLTAVVPFSLCVAAGGAVWAWLYERTGSVYAPWLSHLLVDGGLFVVGYDLFFVRGG